MKAREKELEKIIKDIFWMARRYAHGRHTYAPSTIREAHQKLQGLGIEIRGDHTIKAPKEEDVGGISFRDDYLDDISKELLEFNHPT